MLASIGMGLTFVPVTLIATSGMPVDDAGLASGLFNTSQQIGGALGLALLSTFAANKTADVLSSTRGKPTADQTRRRSSTASTSPGSGARSSSPPARVLLFALLRRGDVLAVADGEAEPVVT